MNRNPYAYIDSRHDHLCRCAGCRPDPPEHPETCGCADCVQYVRLSGQTDPCGWTLNVTWSLDDGLAHCQGETPDEIREAFRGGPPPDEAALEFGDREMKALIGRIEGCFFSSAEDLHRYLRRDLGLSRDFD